MTLQYYFKNDESKYIKPYLLDLIKKQFNFQIKYYIKKICVFLGSDVWKRVPYEEKVNPIFLGLNNNKNINTNSNNFFHYKKFMPLFSKEAYNFIKNIKKSSNDIYESIPELFNKFINDHNSVLSNIKYNDNISLQFSFSARNLYTNLNLYRNNTNTIVNDNPANINEKENKEQNNQDENNINVNKLSILISSKNILSASTITTIRFIREFLENIFLYPSLKDFIFKKILIIFEYYFIGSLNILMFNKQYFEQIFKLVDF